VIDKVACPQHEQQRHLAAMAAKEEWWERERERSQVPQRLRSDVAAFSFALRKESHATA
jgi:hypothetical protein